MKRVMVVEDEPALRKLAESVLKSRGYEVIALPNAPAALAAYVPGQYDCVLVDFLLGPGQTGVDVVREIRKRDKKVGIVMATGSIDLTELAIDGLSVWSCIKKPYDPEVMIGKVDEACDLAAIDDGKLDSLSTRIFAEATKSRHLREDLRNETRIVPPGVMGTLL